MHTVVLGYLLLLFIDNIYQNQNDQNQKDSKQEVGYVRDPSAGRIHLFYKEAKGVIFPLHVILLLHV